MNNAEHDNLEPRIGTRKFEMLLRFSKFRENFRLQSGSHDSLVEKLIIVPDTNYHICNQKTHVGYTKSSYLPKYVPFNMSTTELRACQTMWYNLGKMKGAQLKVNLHHLVLHQMLIKNCKITIIIRCILTELLECKVHAKRLCLLMPTLFENLKLQ